MHHLPDRCQHLHRHMTSFAKQPWCGGLLTCEMFAMSDSVSDTPEMPESRSPSAPASESSCRCDATHMQFSSESDRSAQQPQR